MERFKFYKHDKVIDIEDAICGHDFSSHCQTEMISGNNVFQSYF